LEGGQLFNKIQSKHVFTPDEVKQIMRGLIMGLEHMHSKRIMHSDLKPENIMLRANTSCDPIIADFGLATWAD
jgi:serine/threonine protein kinase